MDHSGRAATLAALATALGVAAMLIGDRTGKRALEYVGKPAAALAFLGLGLHTHGVHDSSVTLALVFALVLSLVGDMCLMFPSETAFLGGLGAFLLGHVGFVAAFALRGVSTTALGVATPICLVFLLTVWRHLGPHVPKSMVGPVIAYFCVIGSMLVAAIATNADHAAPYVVAAAVSFAVSDLAVARQKFVSPNATNRLWGLPLYFGAQLLFAAHLTP